MSRANDASSFLHHLEDDATVDIAHNVCIVGTHEPAIKRRLVSMIVHLMELPLLFFLFCFLVGFVKLNGMTGDDMQQGHRV